MGINTTTSPLLYQHALLLLLVKQRLAWLVPGWVTQGSCSGAVTGWVQVYSKIKEKEKIQIKHHMDEKKCENKCLKQLIMTNNIESNNGLKAVCPICVKSRKLLRNNASHGRHTHAQKQCEKGLFPGPEMFLQEPNFWGSLMTPCMKYRGS